MVSADANRIYMGADMNGVGGPRQSVRIQSAKTYDSGLFIAKIDHFPSGCGTWSAFWLFGENIEQGHVWPEWGEYDIFETTHHSRSSMTSLHTKEGCDQSSLVSGQDGGQDFSSAWMTGETEAHADNCYVGAPGQYQNQGCSQQGPGGGGTFNAGGGGTYAGEWDPEAGYIRTWFWPSGSEPADVSAGKPHPEGWGIPFSKFLLNARCSASHFNDMRIVFNLNFCGALGQAVYPTSCPAEASQMTCEQLVGEHPESLQEAFWSISGLDVYQKDGHQKKCDVFDLESFAPLDCIMEFGFGFQRRYEVQGNNTAVVLSDAAARKGQGRLLGGPITAGTAVSLAAAGAVALVALATVVTCRRLCARTAGQQAYLHVQGAVPLSSSGSGPANVAEEEEARGQQPGDAENPAV
jgi:hypothetical protein